MTLKGCYFTVIAVSVSLCGCASPEPIRLHELKPTNYDNSGILWSHSINAKKTTFERINYAVVTSIDGKEIDTATATPIEISASRHVVRIRYDRDTVLCGYLGCLQAKEGESSVELSVEPGHSYIPCTRNVCGKDWYWIDDQGKDSAEYMNSKGFHPKAMACGVNFFRNLDLPKVAAGEKPPDICEDGTNK